MTARLRLLVAMGRPPVFVLLAVYAALGLCGAGRPEDRLLLARVLLPVAAFLVFSVAVNDLADERIDRVNLPGDPRRPLVATDGLRGAAGVLAVVAGMLALGTGLLLGTVPGLLVAGGLCVSAAYSLPPVRLAGRGAVAALVLPACYVAVPYFLGRLAAQPADPLGGPLLPAGLYVGFIGRILLKDFRDVRGDALFGKRTFLVRHGRVRTCVFSAACWAAGGGLLVAGTPARSTAFVATTAAHLVVALWLLRRLAADAHPRREALLVSAAAITGRGQLLALLAHESMAVRHWPAAQQAAVLFVLLLLTLGQVATMLRHGPRGRLVLPPSRDASQQSDMSELSDAQPRHDRRRADSPSANLPRCG